MSVTPGFVVERIVVASTSGGASAPSGVGWPLLSISGGGSR